MIGLFGPRAPGEKGRKPGGGRYSDRDDTEVDWVEQRAWTGRQIAHERQYRGIFGGCERGRSLFCSFPFICYLPTPFNPFLPQARAPMASSQGERGDWEEALGGLSRQRLPSLADRGVGRSIRELQGIHSYCTHGTRRKRCPRSPVLARTQRPCL